MKIIISPAKKMNVDNDSFAPKNLPQFLEKTEKISQLLQAMSYENLQKMWKCNDSLADLNFERVQNLNLKENLSPAIFSYEGIQYKHIAPNIMEMTSLDYLQEHLCILSGFYGILSPFDAVTPYRLEMGAKLPVDGHKNLYSFWGNTLATVLSNDNDFILNLASHEYSKAVKPHLPQNKTFLTCTFGELKYNKVVEKATLCKMARGEMIRFLAENQIKNTENLKKFSELNFYFHAGSSSPDHFVFLRNPN